jgi:hypothetical protein
MQSRLPALLLIAVNFATISMAQDHDLVWVWNKQCPKPTTVTLQVRLDGTTIYSTSLPLCRWEREFEKGKASFRFTLSRPLVWYGYRSDEGDGTKDPGETMAAGTTMEVDFWQAGGETDAIILGYSVTANNRIYMNSLHIPSPTHSSTITMAPGLILITWPEKKP